MSLTESSGHKTSCIFSPGLIPIIWCPIFLSKAFTISTILIEGVFGMKNERQELSGEETCESDQEEVERQKSELCDQAF